VERMKKRGKMMSDIFDFMSKHSKPIRGLKCEKMSAEALIERLKVEPGLKAVLVTDRPKMLNAFVEAFRRMIPGEIVDRFQHVNNLLVLRNGSTVRFCGVDSPNKIRGWEAHIVLCDDKSSKELKLQAFSRARLREPKYSLFVGIIDWDKNNED
jgi:hypothetical protein